MNRRQLLLEAQKNLKKIEELKIVPNVKPEQPKKNSTKKVRPLNYKIKNNENSIVVGIADEGKVALKTETNDLNSFHFNDLRMCIAGISGSGKSYFGRNFIEKCYKNKLGTLIIIDPEGEMLSLRQHFDFLIFGKDKNTCDVLIHENNIGEYIKRVIENRVHCILDLSSFSGEDKCKINAAMIESALLIEKRNNDSHPVIWYWDESRKFAPKGMTSDSVDRSRNQLIEIATTGRKRNYSLVFVAQRSSHFNANVFSEINTYVFGKTMSRTDLDRNMDSVPGITADEFKSLEKEFISFGHLFDHSDLGLGIKFKSTTPISSNKKIFDLPPAGNKVKQWIKLFDTKNFMTLI